MDSTFWCAQNGYEKIGEYLLHLVVSSMVVEGCVPASARWVGAARRSARRAARRERGVARGSAARRRRRGGAVVWAAPRHWATAGERGAARDGARFSSRPRAARGRGLSRRRLGPVGSPRGAGGAPGARATNQWSSFPSLFACVSGGRARVSSRRPCNLPWGCFWWRRDGRGTKSTSDGVSGLSGSHARY